MKEFDTIKYKGKEYVIIQVKPKIYKVRRKIDYGKGNFKLGYNLISVKRKKQIPPKTKAKWLYK